MNHQQTNNSFLNNKIKLRIKNLPQKDLYVLNASAGNNEIWSAIQKRFDCNINLVNIDKENYNYVYLKGDNLKYLSGMDLNKFDIIDLDAYGMPTKQLNILFNLKFKGIVFFTFITTGKGRISNDILLSNGYTINMIEKCPTMFCKNGFVKFKQYLASKGINKIEYMNIDNKYYGIFKI